MATIAIVAPVRPQSTSGNDVTSARWTGLLEAAHHRVVVIHVDESAGIIQPENRRELASADLLIALHARRSAAVVAWWRSQADTKPLVVAMTGTDLYVDLPEDPVTRTSVDLADALIVLQGAAISRLGEMDEAWGGKASVVRQSLAGPYPQRQPIPGEFRVVVLAHLRPVKDPLLAARAARHLGPDSTVTVHHAGGGMDPGLVEQARREHDENHRYHWHGELDGAAARRLLAGADVLACTSTSEGGANVVTEAIALGVPVIGTQIDGNVGLLGAGHPGLVPVGDDRAFADLLNRIERDPELLAALQQRTDELRSLTDPAIEQAALSSLVDRLLGTAGSA